MAYQFIKNVKNDPILKESFFALAKEVFDIDFKLWDKNGYYDDNKYITYSFVDHQEVIANASCNIMEIEIEYKTYHFIQIGTVMTKEAYRKQGLASQLIQKIIEDYNDICDAFYLYASDEALSFYPRFGFQRCDEYLAHFDVVHHHYDFELLDMKLNTHRQLVAQAYNYGNPYAKVAMKDNLNLMMFYLLSDLNVWYSASLDLIAITAIENDRLICYDIFGKCEQPLQEILNQLTPNTITSAILGFTPKAKPLSIEPIDNHFFIKLANNKTYTHQTLLPFLSHA